jgi:hypothetical protein
MFKTILLFTISLVITNAFSFNPYKQKRVAVYCMDNNESSSTIETDSLLSGIKFLLNENNASVKIFKALDTSILDMHSSFNPKKTLQMSDEIKNSTDFIMIISYKTRIIYGLSGDRRYSGMVGGGTDASGFYMSINITDENPEWQYQSIFAIDVYSVEKSSKILTFIQTAESSSDNSNDMESRFDNIDEILDATDDVLFKRSTYSRFGSLLNSSVPIRDTGDVKETVIEQLIKLFDSEELNTITNTVPMNIAIDEYGKTELLQVSDSSSNTPLFRLVANNLQFGRVVKPQDLSKFKIACVTSTLFDKKLFDGLYSNISGERDKSEVWNILIRYINEYVKHTILTTPNKFEPDAFHVVFEIDPLGRTQNVVIKNRTKRVGGLEPSLLEKLTSWNFGSKNSTYSGNTHVEVVFTLNKNRFNIKKI